MANQLFKQERREDARTTSHRECLDYLRRMYAMWGDREIREIIDRAEAALGSVPSQSREREPALT